MKKKFISALFLCFFLNPQNSLAGVKDDIAKYEEVLANGNFSQAAKLASLALENLKKEAKPNQAYLAKINYDIAYFNGLAGNFKASFVAASELKEILKNNPDIQKTTNNIEIDLIYGLASFAIANTEKDKKAAIKILEYTAKNLEDDERFDDFLIRAYIILGNYAYESQDFNKSIEYSNKIINETNKVYKEKSPTRDNYLMIGYFFRAQSLFINGVVKGQYANLTTGSKIFRGDFTAKNSDFWSNSLLDIRTAMQIYGNPKSKTDKAIAHYSAWEGLIISYGLTHSSKEIINKLSNAVNDKLGIAERDLNYSFMGNKDICKNAFKFKYSASYPDFAAKKFKFASTIAAFDIDENDKPTNIRILASIPEEMFANEVIAGIKGAHLIFKKKNIPSECYKDWGVHFNFAVK